MSCLFLCALALWVGMGSCTYHERFIIRISETGFPCVGVARFTFIIEALEQGQDSLSSDRATESFLDPNLFWNTTTGTCQIPGDSGILLKNIPYGGQRKVTIRAHDSSMEEVALGKSPIFILEASGSDVQDVITVPLIRGCSTFNDQTGTCVNQQPVGFGTLIIRFQANSAIQTGAKLLVFQVKGAGGSGDLVRRILLEGTPPESVMLTNIPAGQAKPFEIFSIDNNNRVLQTWTGTYTIAANATHLSPADRPVPTLKPATP